MRIIVGITGASGVVLGYRLLLTLKNLGDIETHLVISEAAEENFKLETNIGLEEVISSANFYYQNNDMAALISSGSFLTEGMVIVPCSMKTLSAVSTGYTNTLIARAADVCLKENRRVVLVPREMPLGKIHLKNLLSASDLGCIVIPPMLTFYSSQQNIDDQINHINGKILMQFGLGCPQFVTWQGGKNKEVV